MPTAASQEAPETLLEIKRSLESVAPALKLISTRMDAFELDLAEHKDTLGKVDFDALSKESKQPHEEDDAAKQVSKEYVERLERELKLLQEGGWSPTKDTPPVVSLPGVNDGKNRFSFCRFAHADATGDWSKAGYEQEVLKAAKAEWQKVLGIEVDSGAGFLLPIQVLAELIPFLYARLAVQRAGATMLSGLAAGEIQLPKQTGGSTAFFVSPSTAVTESDLEVGIVTARPHTLAVATTIERSLAARAVPSIENMVRQDMMRIWALRLDLAALTGTGTSNEPLGVVNWPGINTQAAIGSVSANGDFDEFIDGYGQVEDANADEGQQGWIFHPKTHRDLGKVKDLDGTYRLRFDARDGLEERFLGFPLARTTQVRITLGGGSNEHEAFFGNWNDLVMAMWGSFRMEASIHAGSAFLQRQIVLLSEQDVDTVIRHGESFTYHSGILP